jgi:two-component system, NtrC family, sensor histidine kinase GlrK
VSSRAVATALAFYRSLSLLQLILLGFSLIALPLAFVLITSLVAIDRLSSSGQQAAVEAFHRIQAARTLVEEVTAMERNARQYRVLGDPTVFDVYVERRQGFLAAIRTLLHSGDVPRDQIDRLTELESGIFQRVRDEPAESAAMSTALEDFPLLGQLARSTLQDSVRSVAQEVQLMQKDAATIRGRLLWQASALPPTVAGLAILFAVLIARPLQQLKAAIQGLGAGDFDKTVVVDGPHDLAELGRRLDWLRERLVELEGQKVNFLRHISHDLKTPLANIREGTGLLSDEVMGTLNAQQHEIAEIVQANCMQLQHLIEDLIRFSIARTAMPVIAAAPIALDELIKSVAERHKPSVQAQGVRLELRLSDEDMFSDKDKIRVVIDNLLSNAIRFSPAGGCVTITSGRDKGHVVVEVQDEGPGIPVDERERVFELFYQSLPHASGPRADTGSGGRAEMRKSGRGPMRGSGLGLAIAREYARALGGRLQVADGKCIGARFRLELPAIESPPLALPDRQRLRESIP